jgi:hypothetical protein
MSKKSSAVKAIKLMGGLTETANRLNPKRPKGKPEVTPFAVYNWQRRGIPPEYVILVEKETGGAVHRSQMRPELYPPDEYPDRAA